MFLGLRVQNSTSPASFITGFYQDFCNSSFHAQNHLRHSGQMRGTIEHQNQSYCHTSAGRKASSPTVLKRSSGTAEVKRPDESASGKNTHVGSPCSPQNSSESHEKSDEHRMTAEDSFQRRIFEQSSMLSAPAHSGIRSRSASRGGDDANAAGGPAEALADTPPADAPQQQAFPGSAEDAAEASREAGSDGEAKERAPSAAEKRRTSIELGEKQGKELMSLLGLGFGFGGGPPPPPGEGEHEPQDAEGDERKPPATAPSVNVVPPPPPPPLLTASGLYYPPPVAPPLAGESDAASRPPSMHTSPNAYLYGGRAPPRSPPPPPILIPPPMRDITSQSSKK